MPTATRPLADIAAEIARRGLPALFVDTCAALDVMRCAARGQPRVAGIVRQVLEAQTAGELLLFGPSVLLQEAARNRVKTESDARTGALKVDQGMADHRRFADTMGVAYPHTAPFTHEAVVPPLLHLHDQMLGACAHAETDTAIEVAALRRAGLKRRPARGGGGANDCLMFEEFRAVARQAPAAHPLVLLTPNTDDFGDKGPGGIVVHQEITDDLAGTQAQVCLSWELIVGLVLNAARRKLI